MTEKRSKPKVVPKVAMTLEEKKKHATITRQVNRLKRKKAFLSDAVEEVIVLDPGEAEEHEVDETKLLQFFEFFKVSEIKQYDRYDKGLIHAIGKSGPLVSHAF